MRKTLVALAAIAPLLVAGPAVAAPPEQPPPTPPNTFPGLCGTTVLVEQTSESQRIHKNGKATGKLRLRVTNLETGASVNINASGPGRGSEVFEGDVVTFTFQATGQNFVSAFTPGEAAQLRAAGLPEAFVASGPIDLVGTTNLVTGESTLTINRLPNRIIDICAAIT